MKQNPHSVSFYSDSLNLPNIMKFEMNLRAVPLIGIAVVMLGTVAAPTSGQAEPKVIKEVVKPSLFRKDKEGVLWFEQGSDGETEYSAAMALSAQLAGIVILSSYA